MSLFKHSSLYKRIITLLLALALAASTTMTAFAVQLPPRDDEDDDDDFTRAEALSGAIEARQQAREEGWDYDEELDEDEEPAPRVSSLSRSSVSSGGTGSIRVGTGDGSSKGSAITIGGSKAAVAAATATTSTQKKAATTSALAATIQSWQQKNSDVKAWLKIPGTNVNYPVLQSPNKDNTYYEAKGIDKNYSKDGVIWASYTVNFGDSSTLTQNNCLFGHNWTNSWRTAYANRAKDVMFAQLIAFKNLDFAQKNQKIYYSTESEDMTFQIFAVFICNANTMDYVSSSFSTKKLSSLIDEARSLSFFDYDTDVSTSDKLITLSTCIDAYYKNGVRQTNQRFVVMGKLVNGNEASSNVNVVKNTDAKTPTDMGIRKDA